MKIAGLLLFLLLSGPVLLWLGVSTLRGRTWRDGVPALELLIDRALGEAPPARTAWDRRFAHFHAWMAVLFGTFFSIAGLAAIFLLITPE